MSTAKILPFKPGGQAAPDPRDFLTGVGLYTLVEDSAPVAAETVLHRIRHELKSHPQLVKEVRLLTLRHLRDVVRVEDAGHVLDQVLGPNLSRRPSILRLSDVEPEEVEFLWDPYIPLRKLTMVEGDPGDGKTWLSLQIAANVTRGWPLPGSGKVAHEPANVLYCSAEDGAADTLRPRIDAAGGDPERVHALVEVLKQGAEYPEGVTLGDADVIEEAIETVRPRIMIIDPIQAYLGADVDFHRANEVRPLLARLAGWAERYNFAAICIRHLAKGQSSKAIYRGMGSIDFTAAARSVLLVGRDPQNPERQRAVVHLKSSLAPMGGAFGFELKEGRFLWTGASTLTAAALLSAEKDDDEKSVRSEARRFLETELADGPVAAEEIKKAARNAGIGERTLWTAKADLGVKARRLPGSKHWEWYILKPVESEKSTRSGEIVRAPAPALDDLLEEGEQ